VEARCDALSTPGWMRMEPEDDRAARQKIASWADDGAGGET
jgi:hypothetical protein